MLTTINSVATLLDLTWEVGVCMWEEFGNVCLFTMVLLLWGDPYCWQDVKIQLLPYLDCLPALQGVVFWDLPPLGTPDVIAACL